MEHKITINYDDIDREARRLVEYVGSKRADVDYEQILLQIEDSGLIGKLREKMISGLMSILMSWNAVQKDIKEDNAVTGKEITYKLPMNANESIPDSIEKEATAYCVAYITGEWMKIVGIADLAEVQMSEAVGHVKTLFASMTRRKAPKRVYPAHQPTVVGYTTNNDTGVSVDVTYGDEEDGDVTVINEDSNSNEESDTDI